MDVGQEMVDVVKTRLGQFNRLVVVAESSLSVKLVYLSGLVGPSQHLMH